MSTPTPNQGDKTSLQSLRVLLVDDHDDARVMMSLMLTRRHGFAVETAASGFQALEKAREFSPHIVISDITMPGMDGFEMMTAMKANNFAPFKSIALSGLDFEGEKTDSHYDVHLTKPIDFDELFATIERLIEEDKQSGN
jgi:CheY-like chemotaxis protein